jgi:formylmethanofuran dehydrogenase subunit D
VLTVAHVNYDKGETKTTSKFSSDWLASCDHCTLNGREFKLLVLDNDMIILKSLGKVEVKKQ